MSAYELICSLISCLRDIRIILLEPRENELIYNDLLLVFRQSSIYDIIFSEIIGGEWKDLPAVDVNGNRMKDRFGSDIYNSELCLIVNGLKAYEPIETAKKKKSKE